MCLDNFMLIRAAELTKLELNDRIPFMLRAFRNPKYKSTISIFIFEKQFVTRFMNVVCSAGLFRMVWFAEKSRICRFENL